MDRLPANYAEWKQCIEVDCPIPLTTDFCRRRVEALNNEGDPHTAAFRRRWGDDHLARVIAWFEQAIETEVRTD